MHPVKVKFNVPDPEPNIINKYKNFSQFIDGYKRFHTPSGIRYLFKYDIKRLVLVIIVITLLLIMLLSEAEAKTLLHLIDAD